MNTWYEKAVFYHMYPLGMTGAPKTNEADAPVVHRFKELEDWVPHLTEMGFNAIYIGPLFESSSHGYDTRDYRQTDRRLGDNEDFKHFTALCHENNIRVVVDGVFNHTGREFSAFQDIQTNRESSPYCGWYKGINFWGNNPYNDGFGYEAWQGHFELPCLNLQNPEVRQSLFDVIQFWVSEFDIDGIRLDCANVLDFQFMKEMRAATRQMKPDFWLMGEVIHGDYARWANQEMLHSVTNYELHKSLYSGLNDHNFFEIAHNVRRLDPLGRSLYTFLDNHDENRIASKLAKKAHLPLAYLLLFTLPGIPSVYYGGEWGMEGMRTRESDAALRPAITVQQGQELTTSLTAFIKQLANIHASCDAFWNGRYQELVLTNRQYAFARQGETATAVIAANSDDSEAAVSIPIPTAAASAVNCLDHTTVPVENGKLTITLPANAGVVLELREE